MKDIVAGEFRAKHVLAWIILICCVIEIPVLIPKLASGLADCRILGRGKFGNEEEHFNESIKMCAIGMGKSFVLLYTLLYCHVVIRLCPWCQMTAIVRLISLLLYFWLECCLSCQWKLERENTFTWKKMFTTNFNQTAYKEERA